MRSPGLILAAILLLAACGSSSESGAGSSPTSPDRPVTSTPEPPEPDDPIPSPGASRVEPQPGQADVRKVAWEGYSKLGPKRLEITYWSGVEPCHVLDHVDVEEDGSEVTITLFEGHSPMDEDTACIEIALLKSVVVELDSPLGTREVADGYRGSEG